MTDVLHTEIIAKASFQLPARVRLLLIQLALLLCSKMSQVTDFSGKLHTSGVEIIMLLLEIRFFCERECDFLSLMQPVNYIISEFPE